MALRLLRLLPASASARGLAAGAQRVVSGGRHVLPGSRPVAPSPDAPGSRGPHLQLRVQLCCGTLSKLHLGNRDSGALESGPACSSVQCLAKLLC
ncbi:NADH dehydrogenase [ubiquinone] 1 alpha subcomplex subunit 10, mitochondrial [Lemmus lemmus]